MLIIVILSALMMFMYIGGYAIVKKDIRANLQSQVDFKKRGFETEMALMHVSTYKNIHEEVHNYTISSKSQSDISSQINSKVSEATDYFPGTRRYSVVIKSASGSEIYSGGSSDPPISSKVFIASPKTDPAKIKVGVWK